MVHELGEELVNQTTSIPTFVAELNLFAHCIALLQTYTFDITLDRTLVNIVYPEAGGLNRITFNWTLATSPFFVKFL